MSIYQRALDAPSVEPALRRRAEGYLARAKAEALAAGRINLARNLRIAYLRRPGTKSPHGLKRPVMRVVAELTDAERAADARTGRATPSQILRRASRG